MADPCLAPKHARPGNRVELGTCIGYAMEPGDRMGRLVAILHSLDQQRFVVRCYTPGDGAWPTGEYRSTSIIGLVLHLPGGEH